jgi:signal transduction histidine kinase
MTVGASLTGDSVQIVITDKGPGMSPEERQHAFDRFWRSPRSTRGEGSGLGLAIVHRLVVGAGGEVRLDAAPTGTGLRVVVDLPRG